MSIIIVSLINYHTNYAYKIWYVHILNNNINYFFFNFGPEIAHSQLHFVKPTLIQQSSREYNGH